MYICTNEGAFLIKSIIPYKLSSGDYDVKVITMCGKEYVLNSCYEDNCDALLQIRYLLQHPTSFCINYYGQDGIWEKVK